jgi:2-amino-4-hydroxy-6-hydroxymethyldihydropteridine diphosphokinase
LTEIHHHVFLGIGSNIEPIKNIRSGLNDLRNLDARLKVSNTYESQAVGFEGPDFLNLVVMLETSNTLPGLVKILKRIEHHHGREPHLTKYSSRTLDIDVLTYDEFHGIYDGIVLPRPELRNNAYVLRPLAELAPTMVLPGSTSTIASLWEEFAQKSQPLVEMSICW